MPSRPMIPISTVVPFFKVLTTEAIPVSIKYAYSLAGPLPEASSSEVKPLVKDAAAGPAGLYLVMMREFYFRNEVFLQLKAFMLLTMLVHI